MEGLTCAIQLMKKQYYMASIDLTDAYYTWVQEIFKVFLEK